MGPIRLTVVLTHPIQYYAPWFRQIAAGCPEIDLTVLYGIKPTAEQQGVGFSRAFEWDADLLSGHRYRFVRDARTTDRLGTGDFFGLDVRGIGRAIEATHPDVVLIPGWHSVTLVRALRACRRLGVPVLYRGDTHLQSAPGGWRGALWTLRTRRLLRQFSGFLSVGRRSEAFLRYFGVTDDRIDCAPHAVDNAFFASAAAQWQTADGRRIVRQRYGLDPEDFTVLFAGKLEGTKRPLDVIRAVARLSRSATVLIAGAGALEERCRAEAAALGVHVRWAGFLNQSEMPEAYAAADCLVLPGHESWGLVVNEALATGLPCIVSDRVGCAPDLVEPGVTGECYPVGEVQALAEAIDRVRELLHEPAHDVAASCRRHVAGYSFAAATAGLRQTCERIVRRSRSRCAQPPRIVALCGGMVVPFGLERMTFEVLRVVRAAGGAVHVIVNSWESHRVTALADAIGASWSVGAYRAPLGRRRIGWRGWLRLAADVMATSGGLLRDVWRFRPTVVFVPELSALLRNWPTLLLLRTIRVPIVMRLGNAPSPGRFYHRLWRFVVNPVIDRFVCNSRFTESELLAHGIAAAKVTRIYNTVPARAQGTLVERGRDAGKIIYVGQVIPEKGLDLLLDAVGMLVARGRDVRLDVVGPVTGWAPPETQAFRVHVRARADQPDLIGRVCWLGMRNDVPRLMEAAAVHAHPSRPELREGFGLVVIEAKAAGTPSVVTPTGALPELIEHRENGWICEEATAEALADGLEYFVADAATCRRAGAAAGLSLHEFSRDRFATAWRQMLTDTRTGGPAEGGRLAVAGPVAASSTEPPIL